MASRTRNPRRAPGTAADGAIIKEGSYFISNGGRLMQIVARDAEIVLIKNGRTGEGIPSDPLRSSAPCCRSATPCATCCERRPPTRLGRTRSCGCRSRIPGSTASSDRSTIPSSPPRLTRRPARSAKPSPPEPRAVCRRFRLLAGRQHRGIRAGIRPRAHGARVPRAGHRPFLGTAAGTSEWGRHAATPASCCTTR